jgi:hypothetical protein
LITIDRDKKNLKEYKMVMMVQVLRKFGCAEAFNKTFDWPYLYKSPFCQTLTIEDPTCLFVSIIRVLYY